MTALDRPEPKCNCHVDNKCGALNENLCPHWLCLKECPKHRALECKCGNCAEAKETVQQTKAFLEAETRMIEVRFARTAAILLRVTPIDPRVQRQLEELRHLTASDPPVQPVNMFDVLLELREHIVKCVQNETRAESTENEATVGKAIR